MRYTEQTFIQAVKNKYPNEPFEIKSFIGTSKKGEYYCGLCQKTYSLYRMGKLLSEDRKHLCSHCWTSSYTQEILDYFPTETLSFKKLEYNENLHKPTIIYTCKKCDCDTEKPFAEFIKYPTCIHCGQNSKRKNSKTLQLIIPEGFELLEEYTGQYNKVLFRHKCGFIFKVRPKDLINGHSYCPKCSKKASKGERKIIDLLSGNSIKFIKEKIFDWSDKKRYDFYLPDYNLIIEYHGRQHYEEVPNFFLPLKEQQAIDFFKEKVARSKGFDYLVISYKDFDNIEDILVQRLSLKGVGHRPEKEAT